MKALITGASSGIGLSLANHLAALGYDLILTSRSEDKLKTVARGIKTKVKIMTFDLTQEADVYKLYDQVKKENLDLVINNAGFGLFGEFSQTDLKRELEMIDLNVKSYHILTKLFVQDFVKKDHGYILNVCSSAGFMAGPRLSTYYATKNYVTKLTMAINEELRVKKSNAHISALCPGPVDTNFNKVAKGRFALKGISPDYVAKYAIKKLYQNKMLIVPTLTMKLGLFFIRFLPYRLQLIVAYHIQYRKEKGPKKKVSS